ncbi:MAG: acyltransferase family protein [Prevotella sp.]|nr:acyltransferase family protein [Prevotella sp.]
MRQTNIELCRIISIIFVILVHSDFAVFGYPKTLSDTNIPLLLLESFTIIGVNVFVLITGYFSVNIKKSSLINLGYICVFYATLRIFFNILTDNPISLKDFLFISRSNWFIPCYLGLLFFSPALNALCEHLSRQSLKLVLTFMFFYEAYWGFVDFPTLNVGFNRGYSVLSFMVLYIIARYIKLYGVQIKWKLWSGTIYCICSIILTMLAYLVLYLGYGQLTYKLYAYSNPLIIISSISFFLSFEKFQLKKIKIVNYIAKSVLAVLLIHAGSPVFGFLRDNYQYLYANYCGTTIFFLWILSVFFTFVFSVLIDQIRLFSYNYLYRFINNHYNGIQNPIIQS